MIAFLLIVVVIHADREHQNEIVVLVVWKAGRVQISMFGRTSPTTALSLRRTKIVVVFKLTEL